MKTNKVIASITMAAAIVLGMTSENIKSYEKPSRTSFEIHVKDVTENYNKIVDTMLKFKDESLMSPDDVRYLESIEYKELKMIVPNIGIVDLSNDNFSSSIGIQDNQYTIGLKSDMERFYSINGTEVVPPYQGGIASLEYNDELDEFWFWVDIVFYMNKTNGEIESQDWMYDLSSFGEYLMQDISLEGDSYQELSKKMNAYIILTQRLIVQGEKEYEDINSEGKWTKYNEATNLKKGSTNKISIYGQRRNGDDYFVNENDDFLFQDKYMIASDTFGQNDINLATSGLTTWSIIGIVLGSIVGASLICGVSYWFIRNKN